MKTIRCTDIMENLWTFRYPKDESISVTMRAWSVPLDDKGFAEWDDILKVLNA